MTAFVFLFIGLVFGVILSSFHQGSVEERVDLRMGELEIEARWFEDDSELRALRSEVSGLKGQVAELRKSQQFVGSQIHSLKKELELLRRQVRSIKKWRTWVTRDLVRIREAHDAGGEQ